MASAKITLIGMYRWMQLNNKDLFQHLTVPTGIDKTKLVNTILMHGAEMETLYADADYLQDLIGVWSDKWQRTFQKWMDALNFKYDPLYNFDRHELYTDKRTQNESGNRSETATAHDDSVSEGSGNTQNEVSAYDAATYQPHDQSTSTSSGTNTSNSTTTAHGNDKRDLNENVIHEGHLYGNIGVTTSQQMLRDELDIQLWNVYEHITDLFLNEFAIYVYE